MVARATCQFAAYFLMIGMLSLYCVRCDRDFVRRQRPSPRGIPQTGRVHFAETSDIGFDKLPPVDTSAVQVLIGGQISVNAEPLSQSQPGIVGIGASQPVHVQEAKQEIDRRYRIAADASVGIKSELAKLDQERRSGEEAAERTRQRGDNAKKAIQDVDAAFQGVGRTTAKFVKATLSELAGSVQQTVDNLSSQPTAGTLKTSTADFP
mmetsp:Transcript_93735/g.270055  ORF Transcript_93735/g.270055 Transcript_93735/m.270055 type:complete len:208 (+) Transcript_93735:100-723(+)|eukprot:CAMPEP_0170280626 /NCGR_PEP_ID=MMETSP0116_2-20130129/40328_1 /TAXON_ID=400756 /ORGANISM="Durinskia baltica, Strain CSIRO CS-38" /LENGTH=207 /DNA_ID=CAMNT_0010531959 /DNA_START=96 /DNA_END=719 /DNA_ORIENTATION=+